jgi:hypothetical protein
MLVGIIHMYEAYCHVGYDDVCMVWKNGSHAVFERGLRISSPKELRHRFYIQPLLILFILDTVETGRRERRALINKRRDSCNGDISLEFKTGSCPRWRC